MAQVKKEDVRNAILDATLSLVREHGYINTTMVQIARRAGISNANIYIYFGSKLEVFFSVYEMWLEEQVAQLEVRVKAAAAPRDQLQILLDGLLRELPAADNGFSNNLIQAISTAGSSEHDPRLVIWLRQRIELLIKSAMPRMRTDAARRKRFVQFLVMVFDGCAVNHRFGSELRIDKKTVADLVDLFDDAQPAPL
ncbi:TetR/AcrR family transcriptional regulator [Paraburkholderia sediminicola]|jgi:AcrR family transcriptional regulator|uniref:TetR/AcrR family transcriptional regulator n=1 Tax=Paraburkholderia sediminicola TaxID=458836 RepID=UPI0038BC9345